MKKLYYVLAASLIIAFCLSTGVIAEDTALPSSYDLRDVNGQSYVTPVKMQNPWGTCWSFAFNSAAEGNAVKKGAPLSIDLSERSLAWFATRMQKNLGAPDSSYEGYFTVNSGGVPDGIGIQTWAAFNNGGTPILAINQFSTWYGSNTEINAPYTNNENLMANGEPSMLGTWTLPYNMFYTQEVHLQNAEMTSAVAAPAEGGGNIINSQPLEMAQGLKQAIYDHGVTAISYGYGAQFDNTQTHAYYNPQSNILPNNHAVSAVGWDDNYPASNFLTPPPGDGAFIVKNSWGTNYGDEGYFYLSYYDTSLAAYTWLDVETPEEPDGYSYDNIYQYDFIGTKCPTTLTGYNDAMKTSGMKPGEASFASIYTADHNETLKAVSVFNEVSDSDNTTVSTDIKVYVLKDGYTSPTDGELAATGSIVTNAFGIRTVELDTPVELEGGTSFSVVETQVVTEPTSDGGTTTWPAISLERGLEKEIETPLQGPYGEDIGASFSFAISTAEKGQSFVYGLNGGNTWEDVTSDAVINSPLNYTVVTDNNGQHIENRTTLGNALIKAYTVDNGTPPSEPVQPEVDEINLTPIEATLSTLPGNINSTTITASFEPAGAHVDLDNVYWQTTSDIVELQPDPANASVTVTAKAEGTTVITCSNGAQVGTAIIQVSNSPLVMGSVDITNNSPDSFDIAVNDVGPNPAFTSITDKADSLTIFAWSEENQADLNAKLVTSEDGHNFVLKDVPVNDTPVNNYFINADNIIINIYANKGEDTYWLGATRASWVAGELIQLNIGNLANRNILSYITYGQNVGFNRPTSFVGIPMSGDEEDTGNGNGVLGLSDSKHLEGIRISCNVEGQAATPSVYAQGLGWIQGRDGQYTGTMWENRPIEAINIELSDDYMSKVGVPIYYQVYVDGSGWTDWVPAGTVAGNPGSGQALLAVKIAGRRPSRAAGIAQAAGIAETN